jgi:hypothetical protein
VGNGGATGAITGNVANNGSLVFDVAATPRSAARSVAVVA